MVEIMKHFYKFVYAGIVMLASSIILPYASLAAHPELEALPQAVQEVVKEKLADVVIRDVDIDNEWERNGKKHYKLEIDDPDRIEYEFIITEDGELIDYFEEGQFRFKDGRLMNEDNNYRIESIYTPSGGEYPDGFYKNISEISRVGGNVLAFDLQGFDEDGNYLDKSLKELHHMVAILVDLNVEAMCRVLAGDAPTDAGGRMKAVRSAALTLQNEPQLIFWIDGPNAEKLVKEFKSISPHLVVAGPGGDLQVNNTTPKSVEDRTALYFGPAPEKEPSGTHYLLQNHPKSFDFLNEINKRPWEDEPWTPDNSTLSEAERKASFISLFDGETYSGFMPNNRSNPSFVINDGMLEWVQEGGGGLDTRNMYSDFILRYEYKIEKNGNSGVQVRVPRSNRASKIGFEVQHLGDHGRSPSDSSTGSIYDAVAPTMNPSKPAGEWNTVEIHADGLHVKVTMNGHVVQDINFNNYTKLKYRCREGFIRLTDHGDYVAYRNLRIKELK